MTVSRVQLALNVSDLEASIDFYSRMFGVQPHKLRPGYANFEVADPPLKLVLLQITADARGTGTAGALNHVGVEVASSDDVRANLERLAGDGLDVTEEKSAVCCYAQQDKGWVHDPAGTPWEFYTITDDNPEQPSGTADSACCTPASDASRPVLALAACC